MSDNQGDPSAPQNSVAFTGDTASVKANRMATLLGIEAAAREATSVRALAMHLVNDPRALTPFEQAFCVQRRYIGKFRTLAITAQADFNAHAPGVQMAEGLVTEICKLRNPEKPFSFGILDFKTDWQSEQQSYPFSQWVWLPVLSPIQDGDDKLLGGVLIARQTPWRDLDLVVLKRIADTYGHAWSLLEQKRKQATPRKHRRRIALLGAAVTAVAAMFIPVPYTVVAPAQIVAMDPTVLSAPIDGVIETVHVKPNESVDRDQTLVTFVDTTLRNNAQIATNELFLSQTRRTNTNRAAIVDAEQRRELAILDAERALAETKRAYANDLLDKIVIRAPQNGIVLFGDRETLSGKPVVTGERIMEIADPNRFEVLVEVAPGDAIALREGQTVKIYLDANPLKTLHGTMQRTNYIPTDGHAGQLAYTGYVTLNDPAPSLARIGLRGTAKLEAGRTALGFWLFRKPIAMVRRNLGV